MKLILALLSAIVSLSCLSQDTLPVKNVQAILYSSAETEPLLVVGLGGSEGGNAWASRHWKPTRDAFLAKGYAFLAIGYFGCPGTPAVLDQIAIDQVHAAIAAAKTKTKAKKTAVVGGSRGADLALLLASYYPDINAVVALSASNAVFPGHTQTFTTSCFTFNGQPLPFVPVNEKAVPYLMERNLRRSFETMMEDSAAVEKAMIKVENSRAPILLVSATDDEIIPAVPMGNAMMERLKAHQFGYATELLVVEGKHAAATQHFEKVFLFLDTHFRK